MYRPQFNIRFLPRNLVLATLMAAIFLISACGGDIETLSGKEKAVAGSPALQTIEARGVGNETMVNPHSTNPTPIPEMDMEGARNQLWVYLSRCISFETSDTEAVLVDGIWYVRGRLESRHETGLWKILDSGKGIEPYDQRAKDWLDTIQGECAAENMQVMTTPTPVVTGSDYASSAIWSLIVGCVSDLQKSDVQSYENPSNSEWISTTNKIFVEVLGREAEFGVWSLSYTGIPAPKDNIAKAWYGYIFHDCEPQYLVPIIEALPVLPIAPTPTPTPTPPPTPTPVPTMTPTPLPTAIPKVQSTLEASNSVWAHLVPCFPRIEIAEFTATYDSASSHWVVLQTKGDAGSSTWTVRSDGTITASNLSAKSDAATVSSGSC